MTLGYSTTFPWGGPTNFPEKIILGEKVHTIRKDLKKRWRQGRPIQHVTGNRTKSRELFHENVCTGVQDIMIYFSNEGMIWELFVDGKSLDLTQILLLAHNDGLSFDEFRQWFVDNATPDGTRRLFSGKIIHWTNLRY